MLGGTIATMNRWGMRDHDYEKEKPAGTYRILLLGSSHDVGIGVKDDETYENLLEERLNRQPPGSHGRSYEVLNLSVGGFGVFRKLVRLEREGFQFDPDAVIFSVHGDDASVRPP